MSKLDTRVKRLLRDPVKRRAWIKYEIHSLGLSMAKVAANADIDRRTLYTVFQRPYPRVERIIANVIGVPPQTLFPERYDADGLPNRTQGRPPKKRPVMTAKNNSSRPACNIKDGEAA